jgi:choline-sulfatase
MRLVRRGDFKYVYVGELPPLLFDLRKDPHELENLSRTPSLAEIERELEDRVLEGWDVEEVIRDIRKSQEGRVLLNQSLNRGRRQPWDWKPPFDSADRYVRRDAQIDNEAARYPRVRGDEGR